MNQLRESDLKAIRKLIQEFNFKELFNYLGWSNPLSNRIVKIQLPQLELHYREIAQLSGVVVIEIINQEIPDNKIRLAVHQEIGRICYEHILIFVDSNKTQSCWSWLKRDHKKAIPRSHSYFKGQSGDLLLSKLVNINIDFNDFDHHGNIALTEVTTRLKNALDIEPITKKFFKEFEQCHGNFVSYISGITKDTHRAWYASVLLHRLMFIWFLQKKGFLDNGNINYLNDKLDYCNQNLPPDSYYRELLRPLFFEGFAKPVNERSININQLLGAICYLNGGLFLEHYIEKIYPEIQIKDQAFQELFALFGQYSWNLDDTVGGNDNEINPDVLGYIFEKYINQKAFGAYYTRPEITNYLCEQTLSKLIVEKIRQPAIKELNLAAREFKDLTELLFNLDATLCRQLLWEILPRLSLLDPACGSGAFLVAAMKQLIAIYTAIINKINFLGDTNLMQWLQQIEKAHPNIEYYIKKEIIKNNLYGVDIMPEAMEIAKLRLFLALVSAAKKVTDLEPLPNIDFNIMSGNSLIGLLQVDSEKFNQLKVTRENKNSDMFYGVAQQTYKEVLQEKNRLIAIYKDAQHYSQDLGKLRDAIIQIKIAAYQKLNQLLVVEFNSLQIKFEQATWDAIKNKEGKPLKRALTLTDIENLQPFHWGYEFDQVFLNGGFDAIITNPPWEVFKPQAKEFFTEYSDIVTKNKMTIKYFEKEQTNLLQNTEIKTAWLNYLSRFPFCALANSFAVDWIIRQKVTTTLNMFYVYQLPIPRLTEKDKEFKEIVERAAALICTSQDYDDLKNELIDNGYNIENNRESQQIRAELDAIIAHLYELTETEYAHILSTFPIVKKEVKQRAMAEFLNIN